MLEGAVPVAARFHFGTQPAWVDAIRIWASATTDVHRVWIFGSRVTGNRRTKASAPAVPDLDVAYTLYGSDPGSLLAAAVIDGKAWQAQLQRAIPEVSVQLEYAQPDDDVVWPAVQEHGVLIYAAEE